jgi:putative glycosyltransferase (TIGR04372 family)
MKKLAAALLTVLGGAVVAVCRLIRPWVAVEIAAPPSGRIGQLFETTDYWLRKRALRRTREAAAGVAKREFELYIVHPKMISNGYAVAMMRRKRCIVNSRLAYHAYLGARARYPDDPVWSGLGENGNEDYDVWSSGVAQQMMDFTPAEERRGQALLREMGVPEGAPFVCFAVRDDSYLHTMYPPERQTPPAPPDFWRYMDYRNADLESYRSQAEWWAAQGFYVLRMGAIVERPIEWDGAKVIDYATRHRSEFGDIYLLSHCRYFIGDTAGILTVPQTFGVPSGLANYLPIRNRWRGGNSLFIPKKFRRVSDNRLMTFREGVESGAFAFVLMQKYEEAGIAPVANTAEEVLAMAQELKARTEGTWHDSDEDRAMRRAFWESWPADHVIRAVPSEEGDAHYFGVATSFLRMNRELLS